MGDWEYIAVPIDHPFSEQDQIFRGVSARMKFVSAFAYHLLSAGFIMSPSDYDWCNALIFDIVGVNNDGTEHITASCEWVKNFSSTWHSWIDLAQIQNTAEICSGVTDDTLQKLLQYRAHSDVELEAEVMSQGAMFFEELDSAMVDLFSVHYALDECLEDDDDSAAALNTMNVVLSGLGFATMCGVLVFGGVICLIFSFLKDSDDAFSCYARPFVIQIGLTLMCGSIMVKTWRLNKYIVSAKQYRVPTKISDFECLVRVSVVVVIVIVYLACLLGAYPMTVGNEVVIDGVVYKECLWHNDLKIAYQILVAVQTLKLALVAMDAWNLRNIGEQFNESKFIGIILYHNTVLVGMILVVDELTMLAPNIRFVITNLLVTVLVFVIALILLTPKFVNIWKGVEFSDAFSIFKEHKDSDELVIKKSAMSKADIMKIKKLLKNYSYDVVKRVSANDSAQFGLLELSSRAASSTKKVLELNMASTSSALKSDQNLLPQKTEGV